MAVTAPQPATEGMRGLKGKNVLVTGGTSGMGQPIAVRFAEYGANVAINYLRQPGEAADTDEQVRACASRVQQEGVRDVLVQGDVSRVMKGSGVRVPASALVSREALWKTPSTTFRPSATITARSCALDGSERCFGYLSSELCA